MGERKSVMRREELVGWLEEAARQLKTGALMLDGEKVNVPDEVESSVKKGDKKGRGSLKLKLEWETEPSKKARKKNKKQKEVATGDDREMDRASGAKRDPAVKVRDYDAHVLVCEGDDCKKRGAKATRRAMKDEVRSEGMLGDIRIDTTSCLGLCKHGPNVVVYAGAAKEGVWYLGLGKTDVPEVAEHHLKEGIPVERLAADRRPRKAKKIKR